MIPLVFASFLVISVADVRCTHEQAIAKGEALSRAVQARMAHDPSRTREIMDKLQAIGEASQTSASFPDWSRVCAIYDTMLQQAR